MDVLRFVEDARTETTKEIPRRKERRRIGHLDARRKKEFGIIPMATSEEAVT